MDVMEKLVELLQDGDNPVWGWFPNNSTMIQLAGYLISNGVTVQDWVDVKDRLPDVGFDVLFMGENKCCCVGTYSDTYRDFFSGQFPVKGVTHWMPLPKPPKGE